MILTNISLVNYKKYPSFTLTFDEGLTGIIGRNGSGKSTIFDAIIFALYGEVRGQKENLKNAKAGPKENVSVALEFEIEAKTYRVLRELRGKSQVAKAYLYHDDDALLSEGVKEVTKSISRLVGMNRDAFMHTVFASQKELTALSGLKNEDRKKIIRKLLGLEKIDKIELEIRARLTDLNRDIKSFAEIVLLDTEVRAEQERKEAKSKEAEVLSKTVEEIVKQFEAKSKEVASLDKRLKELQRLKDAYVKLGSDLDLLKKSLENQKANLTKGKERLQALQLKKQQYEKEKPLIEEYKAIESTIADLQKLKELFLKKEGLEREQVALRSQYETERKEIKGLEKKMEVKPGLLKEQTGLETQLNASKMILKELEANESRLNKEIAGYQSLIDDTNRKVSQIQNIGKGSSCPTCTRPLLDEYDNVIAALQGTITKIHSEEVSKRELELAKVVEAKRKEQANKTTMEQRLRELGNSLSVLGADEQRLLQKEQAFKNTTDRGLSNKKALEALGVLKYDEKAYSHALAAKAALEPKYKELLGLSKVIEQIPTLMAEVKEIEAKIVQSEATILTQQKAISEHTYDAIDHAKKGESYAQTLKAKDEVAKKERESRVALEKVKGEISTLLSKLARDAEQKKLLQTKLDDKADYEKLKLFMGEFKNKINAKISPRISQLASEMYATITKGRYQHIEVDDAFDFFIYDDGVRYGIDRFSGGEVDLANLVLRIAISKTLSELSGSGGVGFLAFDEVFGSQDEERRLEIMEAFHTIKEQYRQIFLISHEREIKEMFERVVEL